MKDGFTKSPCCSSFKLIRNHILLFRLCRRLFTFSLQPLEQICNETHIIGFVSAAVTDWGEHFVLIFIVVLSLCCVVSY